MPWVPELFSVPVLERWPAERRRDRVLMVPYFDGLLAGESSRRRDPEARDRLTAHELQIAQLAAEGLTNREIGRRLYLSHRTIATHLYRVVAKLGITARSELAAALATAPPSGG